MRKAKYYLIDLFFTKEFLRYFVSGVVATVVNLVVYMLMNRWLGLEKWYYSDVPAIILSVLAAYVLNRIWVFRSTSDVKEEFFRFVGTRLAISFVFEYAGIYFFRHVLQNTTVIIPDMLDLAKLVALTFVVLGNRIVGKFYVFKNNGASSAVAENPSEAANTSASLDQALHTISEADAFGTGDSCGRVVELYRLLGDPWRSYPAFHIAGTNGKGSISSYLTHILCEAGHKTGWYTSPYLERFNERIRVLDGAADLARYDVDQATGEIPDDDVVRLMKRVEEAAQAIASRGGEEPTQFDLMTALAFLWFKEQSCDVVVLETGLGGRLDSTNILEKPLACLIGAPGFDHMDRLGNTMREIMGEKAGIIKQGCPVIAYAPEDALLSEADARIARQVLDARCAELSSPLHYYGYDDFVTLDYGWVGQSFKALSTDKIYKTKLLGPYQPIYALMAAAATGMTEMADEQAIDRGIAACIWPARMEVLSREPLILLDGAHNVQGCLGLREALGRLTDGQSVIFVIGLFKDKDHRGMLEALLESAPYDISAVVCTEPPGERRLSAVDLASEAEGVIRDDGQSTPVIPERDTDEAIMHALNLAEKNGAMICVCGSLYLAGVVRPFVRKWKLDKSSG